MTAPLTGMNYNQLSAMMTALQSTQASQAGGLGGVNGFVGANYANGDVSALIQLLMALMQQQGAAPTAAAHGDTKSATEGKGIYELGSKENRAVFDDINKELGIANTKGSKADWEKMAKSGDGRIKVYDGKTGELKENGQGGIKKGDIVEVKTQKYGTVKIMAGGDGEMNGRDDAVLALGTQTATANAATGLNAINQATPTAATNQVNAANTMADVSAAGGALFNDGELNNLLAALMKAILEERGLAA